MDAWLKMVLVAVLAMAIAIAAMGCGSDDESASSSDGSGGDSASLSKEAFVAQANAACREKREGAFERAIAYQERNRSKGVPEAVLAKQATRAVVLSTVESDIEELRSLGAPSGDEKEVEAILAAQEAALQKMKQRRKDSLIEVGDYFATANKKLQAYGLTRCVNG